MKKINLLCILFALLSYGNLFAQSPTACFQALNISLGVDGIAIITPDMLAVGPLDPSGVYSVSQDTVDCSDANTVVSITLTDTVSNTSCTSSCFIEDKLGPIAIANVGLEVQIPAGQASVTIPASLIDEGSYDNCTAVTLSLDKDTFTTADIGTQTVTLTATDAYGNSNQAFTTVTILGIKIQADGCAVSGNTSDVGVTIPEMAFGKNESFCLPVTANNWTNISTAQFGLAWDPAVINFIGISNENPNIPEIAAPAFNLNETSNGVLSFSYSDIDGGASPANANNEALYEICFIATGSPCDFTDIAIGAVNINGVTLQPEFSDLTGVLPFYTDCGEVAISDTISQASIFCDTQCHSTSLGDCNSGHTNADLIELPCDIDLGMINILNTSELSPANLVANLNVAAADAEPWIDTNNNYLVAMTYDDNYFTQSATFTKVLREWTLIEWLTGSIMSYTQIIRFDGTIGNGFTAFICDTLPNSAPIGDCNSGHTLADDVEWPDDISVADHRILPDELHIISMIDSADTRPVLGANAVNYNYNYQDILVNLTPNTLDIKREWSVVPTANTSITFGYDQMLYVTLPANADSLVSVTTHMGRPVPGADVNGTTTDAAGLATYGGADPINVSYTDDPLNGVDIIDLVLMRNAILGRSEFTVYQALAADINGTAIIDNNLCDYSGINGVSTLDIVLLWRKITGEDPSDDLVWGFTDQCADQSLVKSNIIGYKKGDVNDSSLLDQDPMINSNLVIEDQLLNAGEDYTLSLGLDAGYDFEAFEFNLEYDPELISIDDIHFNIADGQMASYLTWTAEDGLIRILGMSDEEGYTIVQSIDDIEAALFEIQATALSNATLKEALAIDYDKNSYILLPNNEAIFLGGTVINKIVSNTININESNEISIAPNPTSGMINIITALPLSDASIRLSDLSGRVLISAPYNNQLDISALNKGIYMMQIINNENQYTQRIIKL